MSNPGKLLQDQNNLALLRERAAELEDAARSSIPLSAVSELVEAIKRAHREAFPMGEPRTNEGYWDFERAAMDALAPFRGDEPNPEQKEHPE